VPSKPRRGRRLPVGARQRLSQTVEALAAEYPVAECALLHSSPWELLVATILSAQCTDERVNMVTPLLFGRYPAPAHLAGADQLEVEELIRSTGFFRMKASAIREMSQDLVTLHGGEVPAGMEALTALRGVGRKTANVVLGVALGVPGFPVDTHVIRLTGRLRLSAGRNPEEIEADICGVVPPQHWTSLSLRLILHGRRVCVARKPRCGDCALATFCPSAQLPAATAKPRATRGVRAR
jgi:endonuclease-3